MDEEKLAKQWKQEKYESDPPAPAVDEYTQDLTCIFYCDFIV